MRLFPIFSRHLMRELKRQGFVIIKTAPNYRFPNKEVYYFEATSELKEAVDKSMRHH